MKLNNFYLNALVTLLIAPLLGISCVLPGDEPKPIPTPAPPPISDLPNGLTLPSVSGSNVMNFSVDGLSCAAGSYPNKPCVKVTICNPGTDVCQTVNDILLDTGSYGLRVFKSAIPNLNLAPVLSHQGGKLTECVKFGDGSSEWGPVERADVRLGGETAYSIPIHVLDSTFGMVPNTCGTPDPSPATAKFNGILGIGLFAEDCGKSCLGTHTSNGMYFDCSSGNTGVGGAGPAICSGGSTQIITDQVQNPVTALPVNNNGVIIELPSLNPSGAPSVDGYLIFGVGTQANNSLTGVLKYSADAHGQFTAQINGSIYDSFLDSGSNGVFFPATADLPACGPWFCPSVSKTYSSINKSADGSTASTIRFQVANATQLLNSPNHTFNNLSGDGGGMIDYGLPFYFGRNIAVVIDGRNSSLGHGPLWAY